VSELPEAVEKISAVIRHQYLLGYVPANQNGDGLYRKVAVRLREEAEPLRLRIAWRRGYYAPAGP
jgi:Ca-activated chloride channel family protein